VFILTPSSALSFVSGVKAAFPPEVPLVSSPRFKALEAGRDGRKGCLALICSREELMSYGQKVKAASSWPGIFRAFSIIQVSVGSKIGDTLLYNSQRLLIKSVRSLFLPHRIVETTFPQKFFMSTLLDHCSLPEHDNHICFDNRT